MSTRSVYTIFLLAGIFFGSCAGSKSATENQAVEHTHTRLKKKQLNRLVDFAGKQIDVPYKWGGSTPKGFDCSGFTYYCFGNFGVQLPRTALEQSVSGKKVRSRRAKTGDLIFFKGSDKKQRKVAHVGIVISGRKKNIKFIHSGSKGVTVSYLSEEYFSKRSKQSGESGVKQ